MQHPSHVALAQLVEDNAINARKTDIDPDPALIASIRLKGITTALTVRPRPDGAYRITDGRRRYRALNILVDQGHVPADVRVPILVRDESDAEAKDTSLTTLIVRAPPHPVDRFEAFAELVAAGSSEADIAARYAMSEKEVRQSLALGKLSPKVRAAWRDGKLTAQAAMAFTLAPSPKEQDRYLAKADRHWDLQAHNVRSAFAGKHREIGRLVAFVGVAALRQAGVTVDEDLFGTDHRAADPKTVAAMAAEKLQAECDKLVADGWAWAVPDDDPSIKGHGYLNSLPWRDAKPNATEQARIRELQKIAGIDPDDDFEDPGDTPEARAAADEIEAIKDAALARAYKPKEMATAGCVVSIGDSGQLQVQYGKLKPAEARKAKADEKAKERKKKGLPEGEPELSGAVGHDLNVALTRAAAAAVIGDPDLAVQFLLVGLLAVGYGGTSVKLRPEGLGARNVLRNMKPADAIATVTKMSPAQRMTALAEHIGAAFDFTSYNKEHRPLADDPVAQFICNAIAPKAIQAALADTFNAPDYFQRVPAALALKAIGEAVNEDEARRVGKLKKKDIVAFAVDNVPSTGWLPPELRVAGYDGPAAQKAAAPVPDAEKRAKKPVTKKKKAA